MKLAVLGCHGGESKKHRPTSFLVDGRIALDAGALTRVLTLGEQERVEAVLVSHAHFDHVRDLATAADNRCQQGGASLEVVGTSATLGALRQHFFNDVIWPDFSKIPTSSGNPTIVYRELPLEKKAKVGDYSVVAVPVSHTIDAVGFFIGDGATTLAFSGDTGPTERFWKHANRVPDLGAVLLEVSFPDELLELSIKTGHLCPSLAREELRKLSAARADVPIYFHHLKPVFDKRTRHELSFIDDREARPFRLDEEVSITPR